MAYNHHPSDPNAKGKPPLAESGSSNDTVLPEVANPSAWRAPYTDRALVASIVFSLRSLLWANLLMFILALIPTSWRDGAAFHFVWITIANVASLVIWLIVGARKIHARNSCNILFLRAFRQEVRADVPSRVLACIGCYGKILWLRNVLKHDDSVQIGTIAVDMNDNATQPAVLGDWKPELQKLLGYADVAVIDFSVLSESLAWEIERCLDVLPPERIILIAELSRDLRTSYITLCTQFPVLLRVPMPIPIYPSRFVIPLQFWRWWFFQYQLRIHGCMKAIAKRSPEPKTAEHSR